VFDFSKTAINRAFSFPATLLMLFLCLGIFSSSMPKAVASPRYMPSASYVNIVVPLRSREYWKDFGNVIPLFEFLKEEKLPTTVLIQYSNLRDPQVRDYLKSLPENFELGLFLEVDQVLADDSFASYYFGMDDRSHANQIFLSGYKVSERKRMIDSVFNRFREVFGYFPGSAGAWYVDALSQNYLKDKYGVSALLDVADQFRTDTYGLWGKPWGTPFFPSKINPLVPSAGKSDNSQIVKIQWAARDPVRGYGLNVFDSTYSVQANDYIKGHRLDTGYFTHLAAAYLFSKNYVNQLTLGLEAGQEGASFLDEFRLQIEAIRQLNSVNRITFVTMKEFAGIFRRAYSVPKWSWAVESSDYFNRQTKAYWINFPSYRVLILFENNGLILKDLRVYDNARFWADFFDSDRNRDLKRILPACIDSLNMHNEMLLAAGVDSPELVRIDNSNTFYIQFSTDKKSGPEKLVFSKDGIFSGNENIFDSGRLLVSDNFLTEFFMDLMHVYQLKKNRFYGKNIRLSKINGNFYFGLEISPGKLLALTSSYPFGGIYDFPFQILSKFHRLNIIDNLQPYFQSFINPPVNCKIKL